MRCGPRRGASPSGRPIGPFRDESPSWPNVGGRWGKPIGASHRGSFKEHFGIDVECYVLNDENHSAVISQRGMGQTLGLTERGNSLPRFISGRGIAPYVGAELSEKLSNPLIFQWSPAAPNSASSVVYGYDVTILIDICKAIIAAEADGKLSGARHRNIIKQAHIIVSASAKAGIQNLVYALAGYDATKEEVIAAFKFFVREEAREYEKEFPDQLYKEWYRLYQVPKPQRNKPWKFMHLTINQVYWPLAKSNGKLLELTRAQKAKSADRSKRLHQFLSDIGVKALRTHLGQLLGIAQISDSQQEYERHFGKVFGQQLKLDLAE